MVKFVHPGGKSGKRHVRYTAHWKYSLLATAQRLCLGGKLLNCAAAEFCTSAANLSKWEKVRAGTMDPKDKLFKSKKMCLHPGPSCQLATIDEPMLRYVFEQRKQGIAVDTFKIALGASFLSPGFHEKFFTARSRVVKRLIFAHSMAYQMGTHTSQRPPRQSCKQGR
jgi:hypothetical protein